MKNRIIKLTICLGFGAFGSVLYSQNVAVNFDGTNDYVQSSYVGIGGANPRTVEAWIRTTANADPNSGGKQNVITDWGDFTTGARFTFNVLWGNAIRIEVGGSGLSAKTAVNDGNWHHVAVVYDPNAKAPYRLLVDGKLDTAGNISTSINTGNTTGLTVGMRIDNTNYFGGDIDEVRVFNFVRTDSAINADKGHELCVLPSGLTAYFKFNEGVAAGTNSSKATAIDYSTSGKNGTLYNFQLTGSSSNWVSGPSLYGVRSTNLSAFACDSYKSPSGKYTWSKNGTYRDTLAGKYNCDSILIIKLTIGSSTKNLNRYGCDSFVSNSGVRYYQSGLYAEKFKTNKGCDSIINYQVKISKSFRDTLYVKSCGEYTASSGNVYDQTGIWQENYTTQAGCDSIILIDLTIEEPEHSYDTLTVCDSVKINGQWYYGSKLITYTTPGKNSCDSIHSVLLTVNYSKYKKIRSVACDSFISAAGNKYLNTGIYRETFTSAKGCDSVIEYDISINHPVFFTDSAVGCHWLVLHGQGYNINQWVNWVETSYLNCDSFVSIYANIIHIDTTISQSSNLLTSNMAGASYEWFDCKTGQKITGADSMHFTALYNGEFAAIIHYGECTDTSRCYRITTFSNTTQIQTKAQIVPNPSAGGFNVILPNSVKSQAWVLTDAAGKIVASCHAVGMGNIEVRQTLPSGLYQFVADTDLGKIVGKVLVQ